MKKIYGLLLILPIMIQAYGDESFFGEFISKVQENIRTDYVPVRVHCQKISYIKGGIILKYPQDYFAAVPYVYVSIELNKTKYASNISFSPMIRFTSAQGLMILVNKYVTGYFSNGIGEADTDEVLVHVFSFGK